MIESAHAGRAASAAPGADVAFRAPEIRRPALPATPEALLEAVLTANHRTTNPRLKQILDALLRHLPAVALEVDLSYQDG